MEPIQRFLPSVTFFGACTWHIMRLDFPRNLKHIPGYADCKSFVYQHLVKNTTCKQEWDVRLNEACRKWPGAAEYLQQLSLYKERWGNPWRIENFTLDMEASSVVEGSFSAFQRHLGGQVHSFTGVVQQHLQKDEDKTSEERKQRVKARVAVYDDDVQGMRTKAAQECSMKCSVKVVDNFIKTNLEAQEYSYEEMAVLSAEQQARGVTKAYLVYLKGPDRVTQPRRVVEFRDGVYYCMWCKRDINSGQPCKHIQRVCDFEFNESQFHNHWKLNDTEVKSIPAISPAPQRNGGSSIDDTPAADFGGADFDLPDEKGVVGAVELHTNATDNVQVAGGEGVGEFVSDLVANPLIAKRYTAKKAKRLNSTQMHNILLDKFKQLASTASRSNETYQKLLPVVNYMIANIQNVGEEELKGAAASYLDLTVADGKNNINNPQGILPSTRKRGEGGTCMKRKISGVEAVVTAKRHISTCDLCKGIGHNKANCAAAKQIGKRLVKSTWGLIETVSVLDETKSTADVDPCVAKDAIGIQVVGKVFVLNSVVYKANIILRGLAMKDCQPMYFDHNTVALWAREGQSNSHYVFLHGK